VEHDAISVNVPKDVARARGFCKKYEKAAQGTPPNCDTLLNRKELRPRLLLSLQDPRHDTIHVSIVVKERKLRIPK